MIGTIIAALYRYSMLKKLAETAKGKALLTYLLDEYQALPKELRILAGVLLLSLIGMLLLA